VRETIHKREGTSWTAEERGACEAPIRQEFTDFVSLYNYARNLWCDMIIEPTETREVMALRLDLAGRTEAILTRMGVLRM